MKKSIKILKFIDTNIKVGSIVKLTDGSALSLITDNDKKAEKNYYIVTAYPEITNSTEILKEINGYVIEANITDYCITSCSDDIIYLQDIIVQIGNAKFRTSSNMVKKVL